jgi:hypothetical protein
MSKRLDLAIQEQEGTSHQAALVVGGINVISYKHRGIGYGQYAPKHAKGMSAHRPVGIRPCLAHRVQGHVPVAVN